MHRSAYGTRKTTPQIYLATESTFSMDKSYSSTTLEEIPNLAMQTGDDLVRNLLEEMKTELRAGLSTLDVGPAGVWALVPSHRPRAHVCCVTNLVD